MSGPASDDEAGSIAAVDGSIVQRVSPVEHSGNCAGSDSGGSQVESVSGKLGFFGRLRCFMVII